MSSLALRYLTILTRSVKSSRVFLALASQERLLFWRNCRWSSASGAPEYLGTHGPSSTMEYPGGPSCRHLKHL